jgi:hypothetical protein
LTAIPRFPTFVHGSSSIPHGAALCLVPAGKHTARQNPSENSLGSLSSFACPAQPRQFVSGSCLSRLRCNLQVMVLASRWAGFAIFSGSPGIIRSTSVSRRHTVALRSILIAWRAWISSDSRALWCHKPGCFQIVFTVKMHRTSRGHGHELHSTLHMYKHLHLPCLHTMPALAAISRLPKPGQACESDKPKNSDDKPAERSGAMGIEIFHVAAMGFSVRRSRHLSCRCQARLPPPQVASNGYDGNGTGSAKHGGCLRWQSLFGIISFFVTSVKTPVHLNETLASDGRLGAVEKARIRHSTALWRARGLTATSRPEGRRRPSVRIVGVLEELRRGCSSAAQSKVQTAL